MKTTLLFLLFLGICFHSGMAQKPVKIAITGLSHLHVIPLLKNFERNDIQIVGIAEKDTALSNQYVKRFGIDKHLTFQNLDEMLLKTNPEGVITFTSIYEHLKVVEACASLGIHVMVEKPLVVSVSHVQKMAELAKKHHVLVLTNSETTWYPFNYAGFEMIYRGELGELRKIIVYDGHKGPKEIGVNSEFLDWLTDPVLNGGGAVIDFGCYGADLITWILKGEIPLSVFAELKQYKPDVYPEVDDDATIILSYPNMEGIYTFRGTALLAKKTCMFMEIPDIVLSIMWKLLDIGWTKNQRRIL